MILFQFFIRSIREYQSNYQKNYFSVYKQIRKEFLYQITQPPKKSSRKFIKNSFFRQMIIDATQQFRAKLKQFQKINESLQLNPKDISKQDKFEQKIGAQYQLSLKYAKVVYLHMCKIDSILKEKRDNYFSNAAYSLTSFTNQQRNEFDQETKAALKMCSDQIDQLKVSSERLSENSSKSKRGSKNSNTTYNQHVKQVVLCLHHYFKKLQAQFAEFLQYNQAKKKKILSTLAIEPETITHKEPQQYFEKRKHQNELNESQDFNNVDAQLERQAHLFYVQKIQDQKKALETKQTIQSITTILEEMSKKVLDQELLTSSFEEIGSVGLTFIDQGNKNLLQANSLSKTGGRYWVMLFLGLAFSLLFIDFLKS